ncbi:unnamed protein product [Spirodela intermedia]|uniref:Bulb-type lectin domain-containing protein n=1 Tax=Spirodela intermedia TaxID=51605 RepID=A0A7I8K4F4_SPIIN|nr:unnamed protein product [Spirodela intermedia]
MVAKNLVSLLLLILACLLVSPCLARSDLYRGEKLVAAECLVKGDFTLCMQTNCNLVLREGGVVKWCSRTAGEGTNCRAILQMNGNFVIRSGTDKVWETNTNSGVVVLLKNDGNVVIYNAQMQQIWERGTGPCTAGATVSPLQNTSSIPAGVTFSKP